MASSSKPSKPKTEGPGKVWRFISGTYGLNGVIFLEILVEREKVKRLYKTILEGLAETNRKFP